MLCHMSPRAFTVCSSACVRSGFSGSNSLYLDTPISEHIHERIHERARLLRFYGLRVGEKQIASLACFNRIPNVL